MLIFRIVYPDNLLVLPRCLGVVRPLPNHQKIEVLTTTIFTFALSAILTQQKLVQQLIDLLLLVL